jgi:alpha-D-xyloside xylohydrolase
MFDFAQDENVREISDSFMFGKALLISPVTKPMYYEENSVPILDSLKIKEVYLPKNAQWYDFWTGEIYTGGQTVESDATLDIIPIYVKAGSIIPISEPLMYSDERNGEVSEILIYAGADGEFTLYNDEGDNYSYEKGNYSAIHLRYNEQKSTLTFGEAEGQYKYQENFRVKVVKNNYNSDIVEFTYKGKNVTISL